MAKDNVSKHKLLIVGIVLLVVAVAVVLVANMKLSDCGSLGGVVLQAFDSSSRTACSLAKTGLYTGFAVMAVGAALVIINFVKKK